MIFVFGSNMGGWHGAGAAYVALKQHGAQLGVGRGIRGRSYALPTKGWKIQTLPLALIQKEVDKFIAQAQDLPELEFQVTRVGCGLAGLRDEDIAPMFLHAPKNCLFDTKWRPWLRVGKRFWGTY